MTTRLTRPARAFATLALTVLTFATASAQPRRTDPGTANFDAGLQAIEAGRPVPVSHRPLPNAAKLLSDRLHGRPAFEELRGFTTPTEFGVILEYDGSRAQLEAAGLKINTQVGNLFTARMRREDLGKLRAVAGIRNVSLARFAQPHMDISLPDVRADSEHAGIGASGVMPEYQGRAGQNMLIGDVDSGIDFTRPDFNDSLGKTRILFIWDQTDLAGPNPSGFSYGTQWTKANIDNTPGSVRERDTDGHGTNVAGVLVGNGSMTGCSPAKPAYRYIGMAPLANFIEVKTDFSDAGIIDGVNYIFQRAAALGKDAVVNLSLGSSFGPHDGSDNFSKSISTLTGPGKIVVASAGNDGGSGIHGVLTTTSTTVGTDRFTFSVPAYTANAGTFNDYILITGWYDPSANIVIRLKSPGTATNDTIFVGFGNAREKIATASGGKSGKMQVYNMTPSLGFGGTSTTRQFEIEIYDSLSTQAPRNGTWEIDCIPTSAASFGKRVDIWVYAAQIGALGQQPTVVTNVNNGTLVGSPGDGDSVITVGAHATKASWTSCASGSCGYTTPPTIGAIASFSSIGPRRDGVLKPELTAPGFGVMTTHSSHAPAIGTCGDADDGVHEINQGTSFASPHVAGGALLFLQWQPGSSPSKIRQAFEAHTRTDGFTGAVPNNTWGYGKFNIWRSIDHVPPVVSISSPNGSENWLVGSVHNITWNATDAYAVSSVDLALSTNGGASYPNVIATGLANTGSFAWTVPALPTTTARVRVTARDAKNNAASANSAANFTIRNPVIVASAGSGGTISPSGAVSVTSGANQSFTISPADKCHAIADVKVDGVSQGPISSYTFTNVTVDHTISATFSTVGPFTITASAGSGGTITPGGAVSVACGANQSFTISPVSKCFVIADVVVDGVSQGAISSYTFTDVQANHTIAASFSTLGPFTITASAGAGGTISPSGATSVACGGSQSYTISPSDKCSVIADVLVDGVSQGAISSYTFTDVQASHTISASFSTLGPFTITASAGAGGTISPSGPTSVACSGSQSYTISPADKCHAIADVLVDGVSQGPISSYTFNDVQANHTIAASFSGFGPFTITATAGTGGSITPSGAVSVSCGDAQAFTIAASSCYHTVDVLVDGVSQGAIASYMFTDVQANHTIDASFALNALGTTAVTGLSATQVRNGNDADGTTKITIAYTTPAGAASVEVWRKGYGSYPTYDDGGGSAPPAPGAYPPAGWTLTAVSASGQADEPSSRDFWYYVAYAKDACGNVAPVSNETGGELNYHLGDVSDGMVQGQGDNTVNTADVTLLGAYYGAAGGALAGHEYIDVGPTTDNTVLGRPSTDLVVDFEDLVMFALNYAPHASLAVRTGPHPESRSNSNVVAVAEPSAVIGGETVDIPVQLSGAGDLQAISVALRWDPRVVEPIGFDPGDLAASQRGIVLSPSGGTIDAALLGIGPEGMAGRILIATVHFRALASGNPRIDVERLVGRDASNQPVAVKVGSALSAGNRVTATELQPVIPNPTRGTSVVAFSLAAEGRVDLSIFSVDGRRVRTFVSGVESAGEHRFVWNGRDDDGAALKAGVYFVRLSGPGVSKTRLVTLVK